jgi:hypothetical protein
MFVGRSYELDFAGTVSEVPDVAGQKMAVGAGHRFALRASVSLSNRINTLHRSDAVKLPGKVDFSREAR